MYNIILLLIIQLQFVLNNCFYVKKKINRISRSRLHDISTYIKNNLTHLKYTLIFYCF